MDKVVAKSDFLYDEDTLLTYYKAREARTFKLFGIFILLLGLLFLLTAFVVLSLKGEPLGILLFFIAAAVISGIGIWLIATGNFPANLDTYERSRFFKRHGADINAERPWAYRNISKVVRDGITTSFGSNKSDEDSFMKVQKPWSEWQRVVETPEFIIAISKKDQGSPLRALISINFLLRMLERNNFEDAVFKKDELEGLTPNELKQYLETRINGFK